MRYGQFCPIAKANEILGEKWTILIVRELLVGARRFNELQRGLGMISPALLTTRLKGLEDQGLIVRRKINGQKGFEYFPTPAAEELMPVIVAMGEWGLCWARHNITDDDYDAEFLMFYLERSIDPAKLPGNETIIRFEFTDYEAQKNWWLMVHTDRVELCIKDPGKDVDVYFTSTVRTMADVWMGDMSYRDAISNDSLKVVGPPALTRNIFSWLTPSIFAESPRP
ncbi:MAG: helix-turn-helix transcriptional regulator [Alphaproteobacteria bacterium]|nr:helix-turn-helix transcriptional regulator [Alphaproteobacteria bacterium]